MTSGAIKASASAPRAGTVRGAKSAARKSGSAAKKPGAKTGSLYQWAMLLSVEAAIVAMLHQRMVRKGLEWPSAWGLWLGIKGVLVGQVIVWVYHYLHKRFKQGRDPARSIQKKEPDFDWFGELSAHLSRPEAFFMMGPYLSITWMFRLMPDSYYDMAPTVSWLNVFLQFAVYDLFVYIIHRVQHSVKLVYMSHKDHHHYINPYLFNAFSGSLSDTTLLILIPLYATVLSLDAAGVAVSHADYAWFGCLMANYFMLIHSEFSNPWDTAFEALGIGTARDHNVHHSTFKFNFGHFFMWWDMVGGTYKHHSTVGINTTHKPAPLMIATGRARGG